jgi:hypothetical protein
MTSRENRTGANLAWVARSTALCAIAPLLLTGCISLWKVPQPAQPAAVCQYTDARIAVDGLMEDAWQDAPLITDFRIPGMPRELPFSPTEARMLWDDKAMYVFYKAWDKDIWGYLKDRDDMTCREDVLELFVKPHPEGEGYCNFEINVLKTVYDAYAPREKTPMGGRWQRWDCPGMRLATHIEGTLNDYSDEDSYWTLEVAIPFASFPWPDSGTPVPDTQWLFHLGRYDYSVYLEKGVELTSCAALSAPNFHMSEQWRPLVFRK